MGLKVCAVPGCPRLQREGKCAEHRREAEQKRGTRQARGYDADYEQQLRSPDYVNATHCAECGDPFTPGNPKTGGHSTAIRNGGKGSKVLPHCRRCNYGWQRTGL